MKITVINGTEKHGITYRLKEMFLSPFREKAEITEYYLPKDCPSFCMGCLSCTLKGGGHLQRRCLCPENRGFASGRGLDRDDVAGLCFPCHRRHESAA